METGLGVLMLLFGLVSMSFLYTETNDDNMHSDYIKSRTSIVWLPLLGVGGVITVFIGLALIFKWFY